MPIIPIYRPRIKITTPTEINPTKFFKTYLDESGTESKQIYPMFRESKKFLGSIPRVFLENRDKSEYAQTAMSIRRLCSDFARRINDAGIPGKYVNNNRRDCTPFIKETTLRRITNFLQTELENLTKKPVRVSQLGSGCLGRTFRINIDGKNFVIKTFTSKKFDQFEGLAGHGGQVEPLIANCISNITHSGFASKFFFGKVSPTSGKDAYLVTEFLDKKSTPAMKNAALLSVSNPVEVTDLYYASLGGKQRNTNNINNIIFDCGGASIKEHFPNDKETGKIIRILCQLTDRGALPELREYIRKSENNKKFRDAISYLKKECAKNNFFYLATDQEAFNSRQKEALSLLGIDASSSTVTSMLSCKFANVVSKIRNLFN